MVPNSPVRIARLVLVSLVILVLLAGVLFLDGKRIEVPSTAGGDATLWLATGEP